MGGDFTEGGQSSSPGIYTYAIADVFRFNQLPENKAKGLTVSVSFFEIYGVKVARWAHQQRAHVPRRSLIC